MLSVRNLGTSLGDDFRLAGVSFDAAPGERLAILGPNGSGKSTLLRLVAGLEAPRQGVVAWGDAVLSREGRVLVPPERRRMSFLFQEGVLFPHLSVRANVALGLGPRAPREQRGTLVPQALASLGIAHLAERPVPELSGGEQQRVALARCLVQRPRVMLLDEPFQSLDRDATRSIIAELRALAHEHGMAALLVTHEPDEAAAFADRVLLLRDGAVVQAGSMAAIYREPVDRWAAGFLGEYGHLVIAQAHACAITLPPGTPGSRVAFRPEDLVVSTVGGDDAASAIEVVGVREYGMLQEVTLALPNGDRLTARSFAHAVIRPGQRVQVRLVRALPPCVAEDPVA